jgi:hypothetical protein
MSSTLKVKKKMVTIVVNKKKMVSWSDYFRFDSVFIKKIIKSIFLKTKPKPVQIDWFRFVFWTKPVQTDLTWLGFE